MSDLAKQITAAVLAVIKSGGDNLAIYKAVKAALPSFDMNAVIEECAKVCDKHAEWAENKIEEPPESARSQMFAGISNTANDCAEMVRNLKTEAVTRQDPKPTFDRNAVIEDCARVADIFAAYEETVQDRAFKDDALSESGRKSIASASGDRQVAAEQIAFNIRALCSVTRHVRDDVEKTDGSAS
jgi:hypothetical protein